MRLYACPHCNDVVEFLNGSPIEPQCDCGGIMELLKIENEIDRQPDAGDRGALTAAGI